VFFLQGEVEEAIGAPDRACQSYREAHRILESLRGHLAREHHKLSFLHDKTAVYENLFRLSLGRRGEKSWREAFTYAEQAKSRVLAELMRFRTLGAKQRRGGEEGEMQSLRRELLWCYREMERLEDTREPASTERRRQLTLRSRSYEQKLLRAFTALQGGGQRSVPEGATADIDAIRSALPAGACLVQYFLARESLYACLLDAADLRIVPVTTYSEVRSVLRLLQFQMARQARGLAPDLSPVAEEAVAAHLRRLYSLLVEPIAPCLRAEHLVIAPYGALHHVPFHALHDGERDLIDRYLVTYTPSGTVYALCAQTTIRTPDRSLVLGCPDHRAPHIGEEVRAVAALLPGARLFTGRRATERKLRDFGPESRFIHIATHGFFRRESPMFSSIRLGSSFVHLFDLYDIRLPAELVTLSGCSTGMSMVVEGDELLGLVRGLMHAGARTVQVSLWDVNDRSTAGWMRSFYAKLRQGASKVEASRAAMLEMRKEYPNPYHWAPFILLGKES
jgi:CHAT domain-containing protein